MLKKLIVVASLIALAGCDEEYLKPEPIATSQLFANQLANSVTYGKDGHGNCYAFLTVTPARPLVGGQQQSISMTAVPCEKAGL